jgi:CubicO group peptidase (beta-lactamase class C family)
MLKFIRIIFIGLTLSFLSFDSSDNIHSGVPNEIFVPGNARLNNLMAPETQFADFDKVVNSFMRKWSLSGATVAVSKNGKLVYAKGFGYADKETMIPAEPYHKFRIASVSKLFTFGQRQGFWSGWNS